MSKKNKAEMKKSNEQVANVPNPPVPNRAHTEMKSNQINCRGESKTEMKIKKESK